MSKNYYHAIATMVGTSVGVGMFTLPFVISRAGIFLFLGFYIVLSAIQYYIHLLYAEIILSTKEQHRVPGYMGKYFGNTLKKFSLTTILFSINMGILVYLIVGGTFLEGLFASTVGGDKLVYSSIIFILGLFITIKGVCSVAWVEFIMTGFLFLVVVLLIARGFFHFEIANFFSVNWSNVFIPYGPIFFAISGTSAIPVMCEILSGEKKRIKSSIFWGTMIACLIIMVFAIIVAGITGDFTTEDALTGLNNTLGDGVVTVVFLFGILAIFTSFLMSLQNLIEVYTWDIKIKKSIAWVLANSIPFIIFLAGITNFMRVISFTGAVIGGITGIFYIMLINKIKIKKEQESPIINTINTPIALGLGALFVMGFVYEAWAIIVS